MASALATGALAEGVWFLAYAAGGSRIGRPSALTVARVGGLFFLLFHHVGLIFRGLGPSEPASSFTVAFAVLGGTVVAAWLLYLSGRATARQAGGSDWVRGWHGAKVAVPYGLISLGVSPLLSFRLRLTGVGGAPLVSVHPSYVGAFLWPFVIALLAGFAGGFGSRAKDSSEADARERRARAVVAGGWRMLWVGLALSFVGLLVLAAVMPDATSAYFDGAFNGGTTAGVAIVLFTAMAVPNMAAWVLFPAMGDCVGAWGAGRPLCFLSYGHLPSAAASASVSGGIGAGFGFPPAPAGYFLFLLVPLVASVAGGVRAARRAVAGSSGEGAVAGGLAGLVFGLLAAGALALSLIVIRLGAGSEVGNMIRYGPHPVRGALLGFAWGIAGGVGGGALEGRSLGSAGERPDGKRTRLGVRRRGS